MWNEAYVRTDSVLILNLNFGTSIVHGSLITDMETENMLIYAKDYTAEHLRLKFPNNNKNFYVSGGRTQFADNIDWSERRVDFLRKTIDILMNKP